MRIVVPFTHIMPEVIAALDATGRVYELADVSDSDDAYWQVLSDLWRAGESFAIVEHDVVVHPTVFDGYDACPRVWCASPHRYVCGGDAGYYGMGCVRFRAELLRDNPNVMYDVAQMANAGHPPKHWCTLDAHLQTVLPRCRVTVPDTRHPWGEHQEPVTRCYHATVLGHLHDGVSHGCV